MRKKHRPFSLYDFFNKRKSEFKTVAFSLGSLRLSTAYQIQELINATVNTLCTIEQVIHKLLEQIPRYQKQIQNQLKLVT